MEFHLLFPVELNKFSDMTFEEFQSRYLMQLQNCSATSGKHVISNQPLPEHKDWRDEGKYVTPVKNQVNCMLQQTRLLFLTIPSKLELLLQNSSTFDAISCNSQFCNFSTLYCV